MLKDDSVSFAVGCVVGVFVGFIMTMICVTGPEFRENNAMKSEAVAHGYAEWRVVDQESGRTEFCWRDEE